MSDFEKPTSSASLSNLPSDSSGNHSVEYPPIENPDTKNFDESSKKTRGRPRGSKNKATGDVVYNHPPSPTQTINKIVVQVPHGVDIIQWVDGFAKQNGVSLAILTGSGSISQVTLKCINSPLPPQVFIEELNLVSFSGTHLISPSAGGSSVANFFNALLVRKNGGIVGGSALHMVAFGLVLLTVFTFSEPECYRIEI